ncbi:MAG: hypothetical protein IM337_07365 [Microcystis sp. M110S1]|uniref:hypothetical protein n=1 Tax=Microcystis sp. M110S1 TaxID=2771102 RepID=UPI00258C3EE3|nr:hypothetical protein [Microcystis sp. M110S1]MCA2973821.1 hypothetical protein [Microcystis sp. M110S1]
MADKFNVDPGVKQAPNLAPGAGGIGGNPGNPGAGLASLFEQAGSLFSGIQQRQNKAADTAINASVASRNIMPDTLDRSGASVAWEKDAGSQAVQQTPGNQPVSGPMSPAEIGQLPPTVQTNINRGNTMTEGFRQGKLQSVNYWQGISTMMRDDISKNPGMAQQIEKAYERQYGFNPSKKYYEEWDKANAQREADEKDSEKSWRETKSTAAGLGFSAEELTAGDTNPNIRTSIEKRVLGRQSEIARRDAELKNIEFAEKTGRANEETYFKAASENVYGMLQTRFSNVVESAENMSGSTLTDITKRRAEAMSDGVISPQEAQELQVMMGQFKGTIDRDFNTLMEPYMGKMSVVKRQELRKILDDEYKKLEEDVLTGRTGVLDHNKRTVDLAKQGDAYAVMQQSPSARAAAALDAVSKDAANIFISQNASKLANEVSKVQLGQIGIKAVGGNPLGSTITSETQTADPKQKAEVANTAITGVKNMILDPKTNPETIRQLSSSLFAEGNMDMLNKNFSPNSRTKVFTALASPAMTQRMVEIGKTNPKALEDYKNWVTTNFYSVMKVHVDNLKNQFSGGTDTTAQGKNPLVIGFDGQRFTVSVNPQKARIGSSGNILSVAGTNLPAAGVGGMRYSIESVNEINKALEAMEPVLALSGNKEGQPSPLDQIFNTIGIGGAQRSDLQEITRAYQNYKLSEEQAQGVAGKKPSMTPDKSQPVVDNPRQATPADPNAMADESELPPTEPLAFENQVVDGNTVKTVPTIAEPGRSSAPERLPQSNPLGLQVQSEAEANANPMVAGFIAPTDGSFRTGGDRNTAGSTVSSEAAPVATGGPLDLTSYYQKTMSAESSGRADAKNPRSSATGLFQFVEGTWKGLMRKYPELGLTPEGRTDPAQQKRAMEKFTQNNIQSLRKAGLPVTNGTLYLAHFAGDGGAKALLKADARTPVEEVLGAPAVKANPFLKGKTAGWAIRWAERKMS